MKKLTLVNITICSILLTYLYPVVQVHMSSLEQYFYLFSIMAEIYEIPLSFGLYFGILFLFHYPFLKSFTLSDTKSFVKKIIYIIILAFICLSFSEWLFKVYYKDLLDSLYNANMVKSVLILSVSLMFANIIHGTIKICKEKKFNNTTNNV